MRVRRFAESPIIRPEMLPGDDGGNINGPSLIRVPPWITDPLGTYYLYFADHRGRYIRLACAHDLRGPWRVHAAGTLQLAEAPACHGHIASPDVVVDEERRTLRMYFHGPARAARGQRSFVALSSDGLAWEPSDEILGSFYFRVFRHDGFWYAMAKGGWLYRSRDGLGNFEEGPNPFPGGSARDKNADDDGPRHVALHHLGDALDAYYTSIGDAPERIFRARLRLAGDWTEWRTSAPEEVLRPEGPDEGADLPLGPSRAGAAPDREHALRDPAIFVDADDRTYLLYSVAGESGIAIAELGSPWP